MVEHRIEDIDNQIDTIFTFLILVAQAFPTISFSYFLLYSLILLLSLCLKNDGFWHFLGLYNSLSVSYLELFCL